MTEPAIIPAYEGEALLLRWGDSPKGRTVTLQLDEHVGEQHPFKGLKVGGNGQRMQMVCVLIDDNEEPQAPPQAQADAPARPPKFSELKRSDQAWRMLQKPEFRTWLAEMYSDVWGARENDSPDDVANETLKCVLAIKSKRELDTDIRAGEQWDRCLTDFDTRHYR